MYAREVVARALAPALEGWGRDEVLAALAPTPSPELGDVAFACHALARREKKPPAELAKALALRAQAGGGVARFEAAGPYLNAFLDRPLYAKTVLGRVLEKGARYGAPEKPAREKVLVEYSAPNANKPLHVGHLRNDCIGMAVSNLLAFTGHEVVRANLVNDRGVHICKAMLAYQRFAAGRTPAREGVKGDAFVGALYVRFGLEAKKDPSLEEEARAMLRRWEKGDRETRALWKRLRGWVLKGFKETYARFGSRFNVWFYESDFYDKAGPLIQEGLEKGVFERDEEGRIVARLKPAGLPDKVVLRADGTSIYLTNDLALTLHKFEHFGADTSIWVVASEQDLYLKQLFAIFRLLGYGFAARCEHVSYGLVFLPEGKMKSREGRVLDADALLDKVEALARDTIAQSPRPATERELEKRARAVALAAIKFALLKTDHRRSMLFEEDKAVAFEGDTGPYLLYTYARARSILRRAGGAPEGFEGAALAREDEHGLVLALDAFPDTVARAARERAPHRLAQYALSLAERFNAYYHAVPVLKAPPRERTARLALVAATARVLKNALSLLNIEALEAM